MVIDWKRQSHGNLGDIYENHKIHVQNLIWIDRLTFVLFYGSCFLLTLLCSSTKWVLWVSVFPCLAQWDFVRDLNLFCLQPLISLLSDCFFFGCSACFSPFSFIVSDTVFFSIFPHLPLCLFTFKLCLFSCYLLHCARISSSKLWLPSAGNNWFHVHRREIPLSAQ